MNSWAMVDEVSSYTGFKWQPTHLRLRSHQPLSKRLVDRLKATFNAGTERECIPTIPLWNFSLTCLPRLQTIFTDGVDWQLGSPEEAWRRPFINEQDRSTQLRADYEALLAVKATLTERLAQAGETISRLRWEQACQEPYKEQAQLEAENRRLREQAEAIEAAYDLLKHLVRIPGRVETGPHTILHLQPGAPQVVVKAAYRALSQVHHPDKGGDTKMMQAINQAYNQLKED